MSRFTSILTFGLAAAVLAAPAAAQKKGDRNLIVAEELEGKSTIGNAYDAVRILRPSWLKPKPVYGSTTDRGYSSSSAGEPVVYVDEAKMYALDDLKNINATRIQEIRYLSGNAAMGRYGTGHEYGAIMVTTTRSAKP